MFLISDYDKVYRQVSFSLKLKLSNILLPTNQRTIDHNYISIYSCIQRHCYIYEISIAKFQIVFLKEIYFIITVHRRIWSYMKLSLSKLKIYFKNFIYLMRVRVCYKNMKYYYQILSLENILLFWKLIQFWGFF